MGGKPAGLRVAAITRTESDQRHYGFVDGCHFTEHVDRVKAMRRAGDDDEAAGWLLRLIEAAERETADLGRGAHLPPWYYLQLAIIYRKQNEYSAETKLLRRYLQLNAQYGNAPFPDVLNRLERAQTLEVEGVRRKLRPPTARRR